MKRRHLREKVNVKEVLKGGRGEECARERTLRKILSYKNIRVWLDQVNILEMFKPVAIVVCNVIRG